MKITRTEFNHKVNEGSSWKVYICKDHDTMNVMLKVLGTAAPFTEKEHGYWTVSGNEVLQDCRVPSFFHNKGYWLACVEHNRGDWNKEPTYELFIVE